MTSDLSGSSVLVTGGTSGIGRAAALSLARLGAYVAVAGRDEARGNQVVQDIRTAGGRAVFLPADLTDEAGARSLAKRAREELGTVDVLVNNAGIYPFGPTETVSERDFDSGPPLFVSLNVFFPRRGDRVPCRMARNSGNSPAQRWPRSPPGLRGRHLERASAWLMAAVASCAGCVLSIGAVRGLPDDMR